MPIKPENKVLYPADWKAISKRIREQAGDRCEFCGVQNHYWINRNKVTDEWIYHRDYFWLSPELKLCYKDSVEVILTVAHLDHDPSNCDDSNLKALCQKCHLTYDAQHHAENAKVTRSKKKLEAIAETGQKGLWDE